MMQENTQYIQEDEIDLRELFKTIWRKRFFILIFTFVVTLCSIIYVFLKNPVPIYEGSLMIEIGSIQSDSFGNQPFDNTNNLSIILENKFKVKVSTLKKTDSLILITSNSTKKEDIKNNISDAFDFIKNRHLEKSKFYANTIMTKKVNDIKIGDTPINKPKKALIIVVAFVTGFILSIFLVFVLQFIGGFKEQK